MVNGSKFLGQIFSIGRVIKRDSLIGIYCLYYQLYGRQNKYNVVEAGKYKKKKEKKK